MNRQQFMAGLAVLFLALFVLGSLVFTVWPAGELTHIGLETLGSSTFELYGVTFFILGLIMFAAMMGGVFIAKEEDEE
ncbi:MAG: hypothetical protein ACLFUV_01890 [Methanomassiliicoccales archaeon]